MEIQHTVLSIDPGAKGAMTVIMGDWILEYAQLPSKTRLVSRTRKTYFDTWAFKDLVIAWQKKHGFRWAALESVHSSPQMGVASSFSFGQNYGQIKGVLAALNIHTRGVEPNLWKPRLGLSSDKSKSIAKASEIFRNFAFPNEATAEAALIGWFEQRQLANLTVDVMT